MTPTRTRSARPASRGRPAPARRQGFLLVGAALAVVVVLGLVIAFGPGGDGGSGTNALAYAPVEVEGAALARFDSAATDPAVGEPAPGLFGQSPDGAAISVQPNQPTLLVFLAHWCPHCQVELPLLVDMAASGAFDGVRPVAVLTGTNPDAPNYPPAAWVAREGWTGDVLVDDEASSAGTAFGLATYPYLVAVRADGSVAGRASGELPEADVSALLAAARSG